jgi:hypothetical protein
VARMGAPDIVSAAYSRLLTYDLHQSRAKRRTPRAISAEFDTQLLVEARPKR